MTPGRLSQVTIALMPRPWLDWGIAAALTALGLGMTEGTVVVAAVTLPVIWRRSAPLAAAVAVAVGLVVSGIPTFDQTRCGVAIPAALLILFSLAVRRGRAEAVSGLVLVLAGMVVLLVTDPLLGSGALFVLPLCAGVWWTGRLVRARDRVIAELGERSRELERTRADRARLAVEHDRALIVADLDVAARQPLRQMVELAGTHDPETFAAIERKGRATLDGMRAMLGKLRSDELATEPAPTIAALEGLLARERIELTASGPRRALPAGTELAAYRLVEHALEALSAPSIALRYGPDVLELEVRGHLADGSSAEAALVAARTRVTAHGGHFSREREADGAWVLRTHLPAHG